MPFMPKTAGRWLCISEDLLQWWSFIFYWPHYTTEARKITGPEPAGLIPQPGPLLRFLLSIYFLRKVRFTNLKFHICIQPWSVILSSHSPPLPSSTALRQRNIQKTCLNLIGPGLLKLPCVDSRKKSNIFILLLLPLPKHLTKRPRENSRSYFPV